MLAQAYSDGTMRLFDAAGKMICDMEFTPGLKRKADEQLKRLKLRRRTPWKDCEWGSEAKVRFDPLTPKLSGSRRLSARTQS
jgi:hypothetical protein